MKFQKPVESGNYFLKITYLTPNEKIVPYKMGGNRSSKYNSVSQLFRKLFYLKCTKAYMT